MRTVPFLFLWGGIDCACENVQDMIIYYPIVKTMYLRYTMRAHRDQRKDIIKVQASASLPMDSNRVKIGGKLYPVGRINVLRIEKVKKSGIFSSCCINCEKDI